MVKQMVVYPNNRMILKDENDTACNMDESQKLYAKWKKSNTINPTYSMILFMWHSTEDHSRVIKKADQWFLGARREGKKLAKGHGQLSGVMEMICIFIVVLVTCLTRLSKFTKPYTLNAWVLLYINYSLLQYSCLGNAVDGGEPGGLQPLGSQSRKWLTD